VPGGRHGAPSPHPESLRVLYVGDDAGLQAIAARIGTEPATPANPYGLDSDEYAMVERLRA